MILQDCSVIKDPAAVIPLQQKTTVAQNLSTALIAEQGLPRAKLSFRRERRNRNTFARRIPVPKSTRSKREIVAKHRTQTWAVDMKRPPDALTPKKWNALTRELIKMSVSAVALKTRRIGNGSKK